MVQLQNPLCHVVQEVPIVGHGNDAAWILGEVALEPADSLGVEVVGGLVEEQQVGLAEQELAQGDASLLSTGQVLDARVRVGNAQGVHGHLQRAIEVPGVDGVDLVLQASLLLTELVEVCIGVTEGLGDFVEALEEAADLGHAELDVLPHVQALVELGLLGQVADSGARLDPGMAIGGL